MFNSRKRLRELEIRVDILEDIIYSLYKDLNNIHDVEPCNCGCYVEEE